MTKIKVNDNDKFDINLIKVWKLYIIYMIIVEMLLLNWKLAKENISGIMFLNIYVNLIFKFGNSRKLKKLVNCENFI